MIGKHPIPPAQAYPKGVTLSHRNILNNGYLVGELLRYRTRSASGGSYPLLGMVMESGGHRAAW